MLITYLLGATSKWQIELSGIKTQSNLVRYSESSIGTSNLLAGHPFNLELIKSECLTTYTYIKIISSQYLKHVLRNRCIIKLSTAV